LKFDSPERRGAALALALVVAVGATVALWSPVRRFYGRLVGWRVTAHEGRDSCRVRMGESRAAVMAHCGDPCGHGSLPKAECPDGQEQSPGMISFCSWDCDLYGDRWVCYSGVVMDVGADLVAPANCTWAQ
jgi:hypothetical protein